jgi:3-oxosteroid 1-dehydrogenase
MTRGEKMEADFVVLGSGAGGLTAALTAALAGLRAIVVEHQPVIGGTSARSSGTVWVPGNPYLPQASAAADKATAAQYLEALTGDRGERALWQTFLEQAPQMIADLDRNAGVRFKPYMTAPDYRQDKPGAAAGGRPLEPLAFDGRTLGEDFKRLAAPLPELMLFGGMMITRGEALQLLRADRSLNSAWLGLRLVARYALDRLRHARGTRLVLGNALVANLFHAARSRGVRVLTSASAQRLIKNDGRVSEVVLAMEEKPLAISARRGVVLAGGGFPASASWRAEQLPKPTPEYTSAAPGCDGSTLSLAMDAGAALDRSGQDNALWFPSSIAKRSDGSTAVYPHIVLDRAKPGLIAVNAVGMRFVNEAVSYHEFVRAMYRANTNAQSIPAWLICDRQFIQRYGLGLIRPRIPGVRKYVASGYLQEAGSIAELAAALKLPADALQATVVRFNEFAMRGNDEDFGKGNNIYDRSNGDPSIAPNPCLGPIKQAPFYAVAVWPTPLGTSRGLRADIHARVLSESGAPIPGLYTCGNDMQSAFGGEYPGAGAQLGQAMTFGWIAARHAQQVRDDAAQPSSSFTSTHNH